MWTMPRRSATLTAAVRSPTLSFAKMFLRCTWTVSSLMPSSAAISLLRLPFRHQLHDLHFARRQRRLRRPFVQPGLDVGADRTPARVDLADEPDEIVRQRVLQQVGRRPGGQRAMDVFVALIHRQHDDPGVRVLAPDRLDGFESAHGRQLQIHQRDVGPFAFEERDRFFACRSRADHFHVGLAGDDESDALANDAVIVDAEHANC